MLFLSDQSVQHYVKKSFLFFFFLAFQSFLTNYHNVCRCSNLSIPIISVWDEVNHLYVLFPDKLNVGHTPVNMKVISHGKWVWFIEIIHQLLANIHI